jgi:hypothetical protein
MTTTSTPSNTIADLSPAAIVALSKMLSDTVIDNARDQLEPGDHPVEVVLHLRGEINVDEDSETLQVNRLQPLLLLKLAMQKLNNVSLDALVGEAAEILAKRNEERHRKQKAAEAKAAGKKVPEVEIEEPADEVAFKETVNKAYKRLARKTAQRKRGSVVFEGDLTPAEA